MPKNRSKNSEEWLKGQLRELTKENRNLKRRVRELERTEHMYEDAILGEDDIEYEIAPLKKTCSSCGKGKLEVINILDRVFQTCDVCGERKKISGPK